VNGTLYGTTAALFNGCDYILGCGTVYSVSLSGTEKVLYGFGNGSTYSGFYQRRTRYLQVQHERSYVRAQHH
jgi:hypothetical protein